MSTSLHRFVRGPVIAACACAAAMVFVGTPRAAQAQDGAQRTFATAQDAVDALITANRDNDVGALRQLLGPEADNLISSGDETQDRNDRARFVASYEAHHRLSAKSRSRMTLLVGPKEWPLPIPLVRRDGRWQFDAAKGVQELLYRRIGANELAAIKVCRALYHAQLDYAATGHDGAPAGAYAQHYRSAPGKQDGLYWPAAEGEPASPAGPLVADAEAAGYEQGKHQPYHGYYYRLLRAQGPHAHGGARDYVVDGRMTGGFAILAYPAEYGASGIMTFLVGPDGTLYEKNLGATTADDAKAITAFDPDPGWSRLADAQ